jgi:hypothetical protein
MLTMLLALALNQTTAPDPIVWYRQAAACMGSARAAHPPEGDAQPASLNEDALVWGLVMASAGPAAGRSTEAEQAADAAAEEAFFRQVRAFRPEALQAHQAYCRAIRP